MSWNDPVTSPFPLQEIASRRVDFPDPKTNFDQVTTSRTWSSSNPIDFSRACLDVDIFDELGDWWRHEYAGPTKETLVKRSRITC